jgi:hypothetical protein
MMSYNDLVNESLTIINEKVQSYNGDNNSFHEKCDYIELLALLNSDELYKHNLKSRFFGEEEDRQEAELIQEERQARINDEQEQVLNDLFEILLFRQSKFNIDYPFDVTVEEIKLKGDLNKKQKIYIILLCCANLSTFKKNLQSSLADEFEEITYCALRKYLSTYEVKRLGYNSDYPGKNTRDKIKEFSNSINVPIYEERINEIPLRANKEKGVDIVAWNNFSDNIPNALFYLIQCACGKDTRKKIYEPATYFDYIDFNKFKKNPIITLAIPKAVLIREGHVEKMNQVAMMDTLYLDRLRLLECYNMSPDMSCVDEVDAFNLVEKLIEETITILD